MHHEITPADVNLGDLGAGLSQAFQFSQGCPAELWCVEPGERVLSCIHTLQGRVASQVEGFQRGDDRGDAQVCPMTSALA